MYCNNKCRFNFINHPFSPSCLLQSLYQSWMVTAGKLGLQRQGVCDNFLCKDAGIYCGMSADPAVYVGIERDMACCALRRTVNDCTLPLFSRSVF